MANNYSTMALGTGYDKYANEMNRPNQSVTPNGTITAYNPKYGKYYSGQNITDVENMMGAETQRQQQITEGSDFSPYQNQLNNLLRDPSKVQQTAGYQFALDQGNQSINRSAAAKGMLNSGNVLAELAKYGQGMASQQYDTETNRLASLMQNAQQFGLNSGYLDKWKTKIPNEFNTDVVPAQKPNWY